MSTSSLRQKVVARARSTRCWCRERASCSTVASSWLLERTRPGQQRSSRWRPIRRRAKQNLSASGSCTFWTLSPKILDEYEIRGDASARLIAQLRDAALLTGDHAKRRLVRRVMDYVRRAFNVKSAETTLSFDLTTGMPTGVTGKITFDEPSDIERAKGALYIDDLYQLADEALSAADYQVWLVLDRLDDCVSRTPGNLQENALRALVPGIWRSAASQQCLTEDLPSIRHLARHHGTGVSGSESHHPRAQSGVECRDASTASNAASRSQRQPLRILPG